MRGHAVQRELPRQQALERCPGGGGDAHVDEAAQHGHAGRDQVVAARLRAHDGLIDASRAGLEDAPEEVDHEVVADVVPAVHIAMEGVDRAQHRRHLAGAVAVGVLGVVHERHPHRAIVGGDPRTGDSPGPRPASDDRRLARSRRKQGAERGSAAACASGPASSASRRAPPPRAHVDELQAHAAERPARAQLHRGASRPSTPDRPSRCSDGWRGVGAVAVLRRPSTHAAPPSARGRAKRSSSAAGAVAAAHSTPTRSAFRAELRPSSTPAGSAPTQWAKQTRIGDRRRERAF